MKTLVATQSLLIVVPVLGRPHRVQPLLHSALSCSPPGTRVLFIPTPGDRGEIAALEAHGAEFLVAPAHWRLGDFARKTNFAISETKEQYILSAADDLDFRPGWFEAAVRLFSVKGVGVVGTNDLGHERVTSGRHATHNLVSREYVETYGTIDEQGKLYHEGYTHSFCDDELVGTAKSRGAWVFAEGAVIRHMHPDFKTAPPDKIYQMGRRFFTKDRQLFRRRQRMWA